MEYKLNDIEKILEFKSWDSKKKIDELLRIDCSMYTNIGVDTSKTEKLEVKRNSRKIYMAINKIDHRLGSLLLSNIDEKV